MTELTIKIDNLLGIEITQFLEEHLQDMRSVSPPESKHALDLSDLKKPDITFWSLYEDSVLIGCGALKELDVYHGEIKSMRISEAQQGQGLASYLLEHIIAAAKGRDYKRLSLETGAMDFFKPARELYRKFGFVQCEPFADYVEDTNSVFMSINL